jgi:aminoglycoside phosphotransferase (APT) family kinase protein
MVATDLSDRLLEVLRASSGHPGLTYARTPEPLTGGFWAELLQFSVTGAPDGWPSALVARLMPDEQLARKETVVQTAVANAGYPTPIVRVSGDASAGLGRAFMVMDRAPGGPLLAGLDGLGALLRAPRLARRVPDVLAKSMAALHALDPTAVGDELARTAGVTASIGEMLDGLAQGASACERVDLHDAAASLTARSVADDSLVICHGDLHPFNLLAASNGEVTVLDWSAAILAPRTYDVAFTSLLLTEPPLALPERLRPIVRSVGRRLASRFVRSYERDSVSTVDRNVLRYFQAVVCLRALVEVAFWVAGGVVDAREGHPWLTNGAPFAALLSDVTGVDVMPR